MLWKTHMAGGAILGALTSSYMTSDITSQVIFIGCCSAGALLPDIDSIHSKLGRMFMPVSASIQLIFGHRGIFHTLLLPAVLGAVLHLIYPAYDVYLIPLLIGYISHLLLDILNPEGIPLLWPLKKRFSIPLMETGGIIEQLFFISLSLIFILIVPGAVMGGKMF